jgi:hypothetical protein
LVAFILADQVDFPLAKGNLILILVLVQVGVQVMCMYLADLFQFHICLLEVLGIHRQVYLVGEADRGQSEYLLAD